MITRQIVLVDYFGRFTDINQQIHKNMTGSEYNKKVRELKCAKQKEIAKAIEEYKRQVRMASDDLKIEKAAICCVYDRSIESLGKPERNHMSHVRQTAFAFMRYLKRQIFEFRADEKEFVYECGQIAARVNQHFDIGEETVKFTITVEMQLKEHNNQ